MTTIPPIEDWSRHFLRAAPLILALLLDVFPLNFHSKWKELVSYHVEDDVEDLDREEADWRYEQTTVYLYDRLRTKYTLLISLTYVGFLFQLETAKSMNEAHEGYFLIAGSLFFLFAFVSFVLTDRWYKLEEDGRNRGKYYKYYYEKAEDPGIKEHYVRIPITWIDRFFSPIKITVVVQIILITLVIILGIFPLSKTFYAAIGSLIVISAFGFLVFPNKRLRT